jgi:hypothetical protein
MPILTIGCLALGLSFAVVLIWFDGIASFVRRRQ